ARPTESNTTPVTFRLAETLPCARAAVDARTSNASDCAVVMGLSVLSCARICTQLPYLHNGTRAIRFDPRGATRSVRLRRLALLALISSASCSDPLNQYRVDVFTEGYASPRGGPPIPVAFVENQ